MVPCKLFVLLLFRHGVKVIERIHSCGQQPCKFTGTKERFYIRKEFGRRNVMVYVKPGE